MFTYLSNLTSQEVLNYPSSPLQDIADSSAYSSCSGHCVFAVVPDDAESAALGQLVLDKILSPDISIELLLFSTMDDLDNFHDENNGTVLAGLVWTDTNNYHNYTLRLPSDLLPADDDTTSDSAANR